MAYFFSGSDELAKADDSFDLSYDIDTDTDLGFIPLIAGGIGLFAKALPLLKAAAPAAKAAMTAAAQKKAAARAAAQARATQLAQLAQRKQAEDRARAQQRQAQQQAEAQARSMQQASQQQPEWEFFPQHGMWYNFNFRRWFDPRSNQYV